MSPNVVRAESTSKTDATKLSPSFLIVDLDGKGFEITPLKDSQVYTDVDGDGMAEHTAWIKPNEAFLGVIDYYQRQSLSSSMKLFTATYTNGMSKIQAHDKNKDGKYNEVDFRSFIYNHEQRKFQELVFYIAVDKNETGLPETGKTAGVECEFKSLDYFTDQNGNSYGTIYCADKSYKFKEVRFEYEDNHQVWTSMCKKLFLEGLSREDFKSNCLDKGYEPTKKNGNTRVWTIPLVNQSTTSQKP